MGNRPKQNSSNLIAINKSAKYEYFIEESFEAGLVLEGWEVKALRAKKAQLNESYILLKKGEAWLFGSHINPLPTASAHIQPEVLRTRKLLLNKRELNRLIGATQKKGYSCIPLNLHWNNNRVKCDIALAKGKKLHDKRAVEKDRDWSRQKQRLMRQH